MGAVKGGGGERGGVGGRRGGGGWVEGVFGRGEEGAYGLRALRGEVCEGEERCGCGYVRGSVWLAGTREHHHSNGPSFPHAHLDQKKNEQRNQVPMHQYEKSWQPAPKTRMNIEQALSR